MNQTADPMNPLLEALSGLLMPLIREAVRLEFGAALRNASGTRAATMTPQDVALEYGVDDRVIHGLVNAGSLRNVGNSRRFRVLRHEVEAHFGITQP